MIVIVQSIYELLTFRFWVNRCWRRRNYLACGRRCTDQAPMRDPKYYSKIPWGPLELPGEPLWCQPLVYNRRQPLILRHCFKKSPTTHSISFTSEHYTLYASFYRDLSLIAWVSSCHILDQFWVKCVSSLITTYSRFIVKNKHIRPNDYSYSL